MQADDDVGKVAQVTPVVVCTRLYFSDPQPQHTDASQPKHSSSS
jgi:hypothetical protein